MGRFLSPDEFTGGPVDAFSPEAVPPSPLPYAVITNPQSLNKYGYAYDNPLRYTDPDGHDDVDYWFGVINSLSNNFTLGAVPRQELGSSDLKAGQAVGDAVSVVLGGVGAAAAFTADFAVDVGTGGAALVAAPIQAAAVAYPAAVAASGAIHLAKDISNPYGSKGAPDHQAKVQELAEKAKGEAKPGDTVESNKQIKGHPSTKRPDGQIVDAKGRTKKVFEAERHPNRTRNLKREKECKKLRIPNETHPVK